MCPGLHNGSYGNWLVVTNPCSIHLGFYDLTWSVTITVEKLCYGWVSAETWNSYLLSLISVTQCTDDHSSQNQRYNYGGLCQAKTYFGKDSREQCYPEHYKQYAFKYSVKLLQRYGHMYRRSIWQYLEELNECLYYVYMYICLYGSVTHRLILHDPLPLHHTRVTVTIVWDQICNYPCTYFLLSNHAVSYYCYYYHYQY